MKFNFILSTKPLSECPKNEKYVSGSSIYFPCMLLSQIQSSSSLSQSNCFHGSLFLCSRITIQMLSVGDLSTFYRDFHGHCSQGVRDIILVPLRRVRTTRNSTHSHPFRVSLPTPRTLSNKSSFIPRTCSLWNLLPSSCFPESYNLPSFKSKINILDLISLSPLSFSLSFFFPCWVFVKATMAFPQHNPSKKKSKKFVLYRGRWLVGCSMHLLYFSCTLLPLCTQQ